MANFFAQPDKQRSAAELFSLAKQYAAKRNLHQAEKFYRKALALKADFAEAHNNLGNILSNSDRFKEAVFHFTRAIELKPTIALLHNNLGHALLSQGKFQEAIAVYRTAVSLQPSADAHNGLGSALNQMSEVEEAQRQFAKALELNASHIMARVNLGLSLAEHGDAVQALEHAGILARAASVPDFPLKMFGVLLARAGCPDGARVCLQQYLASDPDDREGIALILAALGGELPRRLKDVQIKHIYSNRAQSWDQIASGPTGYQGHKLVALTTEALTGDAAGLDIIDAGCGTGLVGELLRKKARRLVGIDLSAPMIEKAKEKKIYDELHGGDLLDYLQHHPWSCDVITSAATLIHFGDLGPVLAAAATCLRVEGLFIFTLFPNDDPDNVAAGTLDGFAQGGCFRHGRNYVVKIAAQAGFHVEMIRTETHEYLRKRAVEGLVVALRRAARPIDAAVGQDGMAA